MEAAQIYHVMVMVEHKHPQEVAQVHLMLQLEDLVMVQVLILGELAVVEDTTVVLLRIMVIIIIRVVEVLLIYLDMLDVLLMIKRILCLHLLIQVNIRN